MKDLKKTKIGWVTRMEVIELKNENEWINDWMWVKKEWKCIKKKDWISVKKKESEWNTVGKWMKKLM